MTTETGSTADREIVITRVLDAPRTLVFRAWTDPDRIGEWWGPDGFRTTTSSRDVRPGGVWEYVMHGPDGVDWPNYVTYIEVREPERLVYSHGTDAEHPAEFETTVTFVERERKTEVTLRVLFPTAEIRDRSVAEVGAIEGGNQTLGRLAWHVEALAADRAGREFVLSRVFAAPRELVFQAFTEPERLKKWWGPRAWPVSFCEVDLRVGGEWRYCMSGPDGAEAWGKGVYRAIVPPAFLAYTDYFTDAAGTPVAEMPANESTFEFSEEAGGTRVSVRSLFASEHDLQQVIAMGMEEGLAETWDLLAEHLAGAL